MNFGTGLDNKGKSDLLHALSESRHQLTLWLRGTGTPPCGTGMTDLQRFNLHAIFGGAIKHLKEELCLN